MAKAGPKDQREVLLNFVRLTIIKKDFHLAQILGFLETFLIWSSL